MNQEVTITSMGLQGVNLGQAADGLPELTPHEYIVDAFHAVEHSVAVLTHAVCDDGFECIPQDYVTTFLQALAAAPDRVPDYRADIAGFLAGDDGGCEPMPLIQLIPVEEEKRLQRALKIFADIERATFAAVNELLDGEFGDVIPMGYLARFFGGLAVDPSCVPDYRTAVKGYIKSALVEAR